ncbi:MAG: GxxExxY protein [Saprospiraceae bacterium]|nr:GxxExxY protein [Saprospiraceae bacterium]
MQTFADYTENQLSEFVIGLCIEVHRELGPGLLESVYEEALVFELSQMGVYHERQKEIPVYYKERRLGVGFRADLIIEKKVLLELKSIQRLTDFDKKKTRNHLILTNLKLGLLINFNSPLLKDGIVRIVNNL